MLNKGKELEVSSDIEIIDSFKEFKINIDSISFEYVLFNRNHLFKNDIPYVEHIYLDCLVFYDSVECPDDALISITMRFYGKHSGVIPVYDINISFNDRVVFNESIKYSNLFSTIDDIFRLDEDSKEKLRWFLIGLIR